MPLTTTGQPRFEGSNELPAASSGQPSLIFWGEYPRTAYYVNLSAGAQASPSWVSGRVGHCLDLGEGESFYINWLYEESKVISFYGGPPSSGDWDSLHRPNRLLNNDFSCFDGLSMNGKSPMFSTPAPFALSLSKGKWRVFSILLSVDEGKYSVRLRDRLRARIVSRDPWLN